MVKFAVIVMAPVTGPVAFVQESNVYPVDGLAVTVVPLIVTVFPDTVIAEL